ncbi:CLUMA_CG008771, isoform A [Clunio marinus]|uniref:CLUMA_CG008771, isoform A n=1 Tax=Clunio marinus TaxID=568069 RepID=A0A1J1I4W3_9DIPT|nr:CLUMA_CG008771, isoform A [Clunio marinus]
MHYYHQLTWRHMYRIKYEHKNFVSAQLTSMIVNACRNDTKGIIYGVIFTASSDVHPNICFINWLTSKCADTEKDVSENSLTHAAQGRFLRTKENYL